MNIGKTPGNQKDSDSTRLHGSDRNLKNMKKFVITGKKECVFKECVLDISLPVRLEKNVTRMLLQVFCTFASPRFTTAIFARDSKGAFSIYPVVR